MSVLPEIADIETPLSDAELEASAMTIIHLQTTHWIRLGTA
jgi:hypothetical protein